MIIISVPVVSVSDFTLFLTDNGLDTGADDKSVLLGKTDIFLQSLSFCTDIEPTILINVKMILAQMFSSVGGVNPFLAEDTRVLTKKNIARTAVAKEWKQNEALGGSGSLSILKRSGIAYSMLAPYLCPDPCDPCGGNGFSSNSIPVPFAFSV